MKVMRNFGGHGDLEGRGGLWRSRGSLEIKGNCGGLEKRWSSWGTVESHGGVWRPGGILEVIRKPRSATTTSLPTRLGSRRRVSNPERCKLTLRGAASCLMTTMMRNLMSGLLSLRS